MTTNDERGIGRWLFRLRWLIIIYLLMIPVALWERSAVERDDDASPLALPKGQLSGDPDLTAQVANVTTSLYPDRMSPQYWKGFHAFQGALYDEARDHFRAAIRINSKDESLLHLYAVTLAIMDENSPETKQAIAAWRWNYPYSDREPPLQVARSMHYYPRGLKALEAKEFAKAAKFFEKDLLSGRNSEELFYHYAVALVLSSGDEAHINAAIETWKTFFPTSSRIDPRQAAQRWR